MIMVPPTDVKIMDWPASYGWLGNDGIYYSVYKKGVVRSMEETRQTIEEFKKQVGGKKICMLVDVTHSSGSSREIREYAAQELPKFIKAIAMVSGSSLGKMLANLFLTLKSQPYPTKIFSTEQEAKEWLKQYL